jgi:hypothetical protein
MEYPRTKPTDLQAVKKKVYAPPTAKFVPVKLEERLAQKCKDGAICLQKRFG